MTKNVVIIGANGKMGTTTVQAIADSPDFECVATINRGDNLHAVLTAGNIDIAIDFTDINSVYDNAKAIIEQGIHPVIGSSGLTKPQVEELTQLCHQKQLGGIIAPNFSIGAIMMMKLSAIAAQYFNDIEIIESHHEQKLDAPSGTATKTAEMIAANRNRASEIIESKQSIDGVRGGKHSDIPIHSVRLPGFIAKQDVIFGSYGETLTISHNSLNRECFMPGVLLACRKSLQLKQLIYGLENLL